MTSRYEERYEELKALIEAGKGRIFISRELNIPAATIQGWMAKYRAGVVPSTERETLPQSDGDTVSIELYEKALSQKKFQMDKCRIFNKRITELERSNNLVDNLIKTISKTIVTVAPTPILSPCGNSEAIMHLSDWHIAEVIDQPGNKYNYEIANARVEKYIQTTMNILASDPPKKVNIFITGDMVNAADMANPLAKMDKMLTNEFHFTDALKYSTKLLAKLILTVSQDYLVEVHSVTGNESRLSPQKSNEIILAGNSGDCIIHNSLEDIFTYSENKNVIIHPIINPIESVVNIQGHLFDIFHGDVIKGNVTNSMQLRRARLLAVGIFVRYSCFSHIHSPYSSYFFNRNGSLPGNNGYSNSLHLASGATQTLIRVTEETIIPTVIDLQNV